MNATGNTNKRSQLAALAHSAGRVGLALVFALGLTVGVALAAPSAAPLAAADAPSLGAASNFAVLSAAPGGGGAVTCTSSTVNGDVGSSGPRASVVDTTGCTIHGVVIAPVSYQVLRDFNRAYDDYEDIACTGYFEKAAYTDETLTLEPGVWCTATYVAFTRTTLTLDGKGDANAVWIFKIGTDGTGYLEATDFSVVMAGSGQPCNVYWWVAEYAELTRPAFLGTILAGSYITITGGTFAGDALAKAAVTMTGALVTGCEGGHGNGNGGQGCNQGVGNGPEECDPGNSNQGDPSRSNDELGGTPGDPGRKGGNGK